MSKFEEQSMYMNKEIALINNNVTSLEQDYKAFLNFYQQNFKEKDANSSFNDDKILSHIEKIYKKIEENTKKDEKINELVSRLSDQKSFRLEEDRFSRLNRTEIEKENFSFELQKFENENAVLSRDISKIKKKISIKDRELQEKNLIIQNLQKEKKDLINECIKIQIM